MPPAEYWSAPPSFYLDENIASKRLRQLLVDAGYEVVTAGDLTTDGWAHGRGLEDAEWLRQLESRHLAVITKDLKIFERPHERRAWVESGLHVFAIPAHDLAFDQVLEIICEQFQTICTHAVERAPGWWRVTRRDVRRLG